MDCPETRIVHVSSMDLFTVQFRQGLRWFPARRGGTRIWSFTYADALVTETQWRKRFEPVASDRDRHG